MNTQELKSQRMLVEQWSEVKSHLDRLSLPDARPSDGYEIFSLITYPKVTGQIGFEINPVTFNLPERAGQAPNLFVSARGRIYLDEASIRDDKKLKTVNFATEVGYFRKKNRSLHHVYGAHYDFSFNEVGHPVFHAQMKSYNERGQEISDTFDLGCESKDCIKDVLRTVRLPTAQMDFFALILQITADHLMSKKSGAQDLAAFADLRKASHAIQGGGYLWPSLTSAPRCMRALHWYC